MILEAEYVYAIENFIDALAYSHQLNDQKLYKLAAEMCTRNSNRLEALDPDRNK